LFHLFHRKNRREKSPHTGTISAVAVRRRTPHALPQLGEPSAEILGKLGMSEQQTRS
jgi:hypothetical protein